jgi:hypothetical protein
MLHGQRTPPVHCRSLAEQQSVDVTGAHPSTASLSSPNYCCCSPTLDCQLTSAGPSTHPVMLRVCSNIVCPEPQLAAAVPSAYDKMHLLPRRGCCVSLCSGLLNIVPMRNALSHEPGVLHMSQQVTDGQAGGMNYKDADKNDKVNINYGERPCRSLACRQCFSADAVPADAMRREPVRACRILALMARVACHSLSKSPSSNLCFL